MKKSDRTILIVLTIVVLASVVYGFVIGGSPFLLQAKKLDDRRISDFSSLHAQIQDYASLHAALPAHLSDIPSYGYPQNPGSMNDPETKKPYDYFADTATSYRLCATFSGDSAAEAKDGTNGYSAYYNYSDPSLSATHKKGYDCIAYAATLQPSPSLPAAPVTPPPAPKPISCSAINGPVDMQIVGPGISAGLSGQVLTLSGSSSTICLWWSDTVTNSKKSYELFEGPTTDLGSMKKVKSFPGTTMLYSEPFSSKKTVCYQLAVKAGDGKTYYPTAACFGN